MTWLEAETATRPECEAFVEENPWAILPIGACEQHGPHLPQNTDTLLAQAVARRVAEVEGGLLLPALSVSYSWVWRDSSGTLSLEVDTFRSFVADLAHSCHRWGCSHLLIVNGHGANPAPLKYTIRELSDELPQLHILSLFYPHIGRLREEAETPMWAGGSFHAEEIETSMMLHLHPDLVRLDLALAEYPETSLGYEGSSTPMGALSRSGLFGDPTAATAEKGERWLRYWVEECSLRWTEFRQSGAHVRE
ncbi:MAG: creatininase family protein [Candidatus Latescibacterota bacterium]|nr:creatininase family protein [Candidatus Latescibacterota bacterium]